VLPAVLVVVSLAWLVRYSLGSDEVDAGADVGPGPGAGVPA
jgi:hypothetical protein